ncbi:MAG: winged helix-turn-helix domain-containing protein, partial [Bryobacteraceae bacterium]
MASRIVQFGTFQADLDSGELYRDGIKLKLGGQPFQLLEHLLSRPGEVVTREELRAAVWQSDTFVDFDHGLNAAINKIREALGDSAANPRFVETVPRRGYRFIAPVDKPVAPTPVEPPPSPPPQPPKTPSRKWIGLAAGGAGVALLAAGLLIFRSRPSVPVDYKLTQVTRDSGLTWQPGISADGNFVAYASDRATGKDLDVWIQHVSGSQAIRLTSASTQESYPSLSADGRTVAFQLGHGQELGIFVVPALGGSPRMLTPAGQSPQ